MVAAIRQTVTVKEEGRVEIRSPELRTGAVAEVIVLVPSVPANAVSGRLAALESLQQSLGLDRQSALNWTRLVADERRAT